MSIELPIVLTDLLLCSSFSCSLCAEIQERPPEKRSADWARGARAWHIRRADNQYTDLTLITVDAVVPYAFLTALTFLKPRCPLKGA
jgi:hypothetical protein